MSRILVVDDDKTTRLVLRRVLTSAGFSTAVAKDGVEALKAIDAGGFDLMLLDVWMPRMNGLELLAKLRTSKTRPRVVVMTSDDAPETLLKAVREQAFKYVHKPVESRRPTPCRTHCSTGESPIEWCRQGPSGSSPGAVHARGRRTPRR